MEGASKGRGRGLALLQQLKKTQASNSTTPTSGYVSPETLPSQSITPSVSPSIISSTSMVTASSMATGSSSSGGGRGRIAAMLLAKQKPPGDPVYVPASDVSPKESLQPSVIKGMGRGLKLLQSLHAAKMAGDPGAAAPAAAPAAAAAAAAGVQKLTQKMAASSVSESSTTSSAVAKNKYFREVKETPPVVMKGESGTPVDVTANFIYLKFEENYVFEYEVRYDPDQDYRHLRFKLLNEHSEYFQNKTFDGTTLYVPHKLPDIATRLESTNPYDNSKVQISIIFRRTRRLSEMIHLYNVLFKNIMKDLQLVPFGRQHFNEHAAIQIPQHKLEVWPGYVSAVDEYEGGLMLTLDSAHRVLRTQSVLAFIKEMVQAESANWKQAVAERLVGYSVMTTYNKKLFRIDAIDDTMSPKSTFEKMEKGEPVKISFIDYYKKNYGIDIMDWDQPMLISRESKQLAGATQATDFMICLVPELCQMTGLTDDQRSNFRLMKDVATYTRITPNQRHAAFKKYIQNVLNNEKAKSRLAGWGLTIAPETINITARTLQPETLLFGKNVKLPGKPTAEWNNEVTRNAVMEPVDIVKWALVHTDRDKQVAMDFLDTLKRCCKPMGMEVSRPEVTRMPNDRTESYQSVLKKLITPDLQLVVVICPTSRDDRYATIKKICCAENPVPSQVINARTIMNQAKIRAVTQKILLQMNCKLGGTLWNIMIPFKSIMMIGIDSYHDAARSKRSVCAVVSSYNQSLTHWYSKAIFQDRGQEIVDRLKSCLVDALKYYYDNNGRFPDKIVIYRDGVGDGQLDAIQNYEIPQLKVCFQNVGVTYNPTLTYIVVQKRINTRIFMKTGGGLDNPPPGTIVDHDITRRDWYDFLIVSQKVTQGTVTPTHYIVLHDDSGMTPDQCQRMTYKMCHLYYNWPGTVRVPAPCQYAHKLAYLVGQNIHQPHSDKLAGKLFFL